MCGRKIKVDTKKKKKKQKSVTNMVTISLRVSTITLILSVTLTPIQVPDGTTDTLHNLKSYSVCSDHNRTELELTQITEQKANHF